MGWFSNSSSKTPIKRMSKVKQLEKKVVNDVAYDDDESDISDSSDFSDSSDYVSEFKEGIDEIKELFMDESESGGDKFGKLSFGLANLCNYCSNVFDALISGGMSESRADAKLKDILVNAGFNDMMFQVVSFREAKKKRGRKKKVSQ